MSGNRILGFVVLAVGVVLVGFGLNASNAPVEQVSSTLTGRFTDSTMWYFILGAAAIVGGGLLAMFGARR